MSAATKVPNKSSSRKATVTTPTATSIRVERELDASRERVWRAYTDQSQLAQWWGRGNKIDIVTFEPKRGGHWRFVEHADGEDHGFEGRFGEIAPMTRIMQTFEWDGMPAHPIQNTAEFIDLGNGRTKVVTTSQFYTNEGRDGFMQTGFEGGMNQSYDALDRLLAKT
jgi:uncharacterized protein YndB with AHSA1/START domain